MAKLNNWGYLSIPNVNYTPNIGNSGIIDGYIQYDISNTNAVSTNSKVTDTIPYGDTSTIIIDENSETIPITKNSHPIFKSLMIEPYEKTSASNETFVQGFLGKFNNVTLINNDLFVYGNSKKFSWKNLVKNNLTLLEKKHFEIFINRFLPSLLKQKYFTKEQEEKIEQFMFEYI